MQVLLRPDTSHGFQGHIKRCEALAQAWIDAGGTVAWDKIESPDWVVLDGYGYTEKDQQAIMEHGAKLLVIDDNAHLPKYHADFLLNYNPHAKQLKYKVDKATRLLLGPEYALIRQEFKAWRDKRDVDEDRAKRVLVALGSIATEELRTRVRTALGAIECEARFASGGDDMPALMAWADVGVLAAGVTSLEACYMGLPSILLVTADNQLANAQALSEMGCGYLLGLAEGVGVAALRGALGWLLGDTETCQAMRQRQMALVDGEGAKRVVEVMLGNVHSSD